MLCEIITSRSSADETTILIFAAVAFAFIIGFGVIERFSENIQKNSRKVEPVETLVARIVAKRLEIQGGANGTPLSTFHYVVFENAVDGSRLEFGVRVEDYESLMESEIGYLRYQGTEWLGFVRKTEATEPPSPPDTADTNWICGYCNSVVSGHGSKCPACGAFERAITQTTT
jgi:hypothetical protein